MPSIFFSSKSFPNSIKGISLSANWMWPCKNKGEDARLFKAVEAVSEFAIDLGINIPTGKDSLSMNQKYKDLEVKSPGTVIISATGHCENINFVVEPVFKKNYGSIYYINLSNDKFKLGGSSFSQIMGNVGLETPSIQNPEFFKKTFNVVQDLIKNELIIAGHDIGSGGLITSLLEMCFPSINISANIDLSALNEKDSVKLLFSENCGLIVQSKSEEIEKIFTQFSVEYYKIGEVISGDSMMIKNDSDEFVFEIPKLRDIWFNTSTQLDAKQTANNLANERFKNYKKQPLKFKFAKEFKGEIKIGLNSSKPISAVLREKGSNSERELANALHMAGFLVKDIHMTDLISGRENLEDINAALDTDFWNGGQLFLGAIDESFKAAIFSGNSNECEVETAELEPFAGLRANITGVRPIVDSISTLTVKTRERVADNETESTSVTQNSSGMNPVRKSGRYIRANVKIPSKTNFTHAQGVDFVLSKAGVR